MATKIAINGFGRIGRLFFRALQAQKNTTMDVVAINDITDAKTNAHLLKYDSVHGIFPDTVSHTENAITVGGKSIKVFAEKDPSRLPWRELGVELVVESTGHFTDGKKAKAHLDGGAKRVLITAPGKNVDATLAMGVNHETFDPSKHYIISNASCTTNCLAPVAKVLDESFGIDHGLMTTIHSVTNDQRVLDLPHEDPRRARAAFESMIPTTTGAAKAIGLVLPNLNGRLNGLAVRVPTPNVSLVDLVVQVRKEVTVDEVNKALTAAANGALKGVLAVSNEPLVSTDYNGNAASSTVDLALTDVIQKKMVKVIAWYDNEWGYSNRCVDVANLMIRKAS
jgi:glyceraldehyde 3-phosphate dehydrogenase (phosphorylating)